MINKADGRNYWNSVNADVDGMLGGIPSLEGYSFVSRVDLQGSRSFLAKLGIGTRNGRRKVVNALEGGAGLVSRERYESIWVPTNDHLTTQDRQGH